MTRKRLEASEVDLKNSRNVSVSVYLGGQTWSSAVFLLRIERPRNSTSTRSVDSGKRIKLRLGWVLTLLELCAI